MGPQRHGDFLMLFVCVPEGTRKFLWGDHEIYLGLDVCKVSWLPPIPKVIRVADAPRSLPSGNQSWPWETSVASHGDLVRWENHRTGRFSSHVWWHRRVRWGPLMWSFQKHWACQIGGGSNLPQSRQEQLPPHPWRLTRQTRLQGNQQEVKDN